MYSARVKKSKSIFPLLITFQGVSFKEPMPQL